MIDKGTSYNYTILRVDIGSDEHRYIVQLWVGYVTSMAFPCAVVSTVQSKRQPVRTASSPCTLCR